MGLEEFRTDDVEPGDTYFEMRIIGEAVVEHPRVYENLPRELRNMFPPNVNYTEEFVKTKIPFEFTVRGHSQPQAWESSRDKLQAIENTEFDNEVTEVLHARVRHENMEEKQKDW